MSARPAAPPTHRINVSPASLDGDFLIGPLETLGPGPWAGRPHRHDFVELVLVTGGAGFHHIDTESIAIAAPQLFLIAPGQLHHWEETAPVTGTIVLFGEDFLTGEGGPEAGLPGWTNARLRPTDAQRRRLERVFAELRAELALPDALQARAIRTLLSLLLLQLRRLAPDPTAGPSRGLSASFERLVRERASATLTVAECAKALGITPGHLAETVGQHAGRSAGELSGAEVVREAPLLLARAALGCSQIAARLGFDDASYFSRFFRRECGLTPTAFRRAQLGIAA